MDKYDQLKKVIQDANPEIMEVKFGCRVVGENWYGTLTGRVLAGLVDVRLDKTSSSTLWKVQQLEVLGRPIRLADVLLAMQSSISNPDIPDIPDEKFETIMWRWKWQDDNLDNQSDETKQFLIDLLCKD